MAFITVRLGVSSLHVEPPGEAGEAAPGTRSVGDGVLVLAKAALLGLGAAVLLASRLGPEVLPRVIRNETRGVSMRCPRGWRGTERLLNGVAAFKYDGRCRTDVTLMRFAWQELTAIRSDFAPWLPDSWPRHDQPGCLADVAACVGMVDEPAWTFVESTMLCGRQALLLVAPRHSAGQPWGALVVAPGEDLLFLDLRASSQADLRAAWPQWKALVRSVRAEALQP